MTADRTWLGWAVLLISGAAALWMMRGIYERENADPWTRDGLVQADLVLVASPLSGTAESVDVKSSDEVQEGEDKKITYKNTLKCSFDCWQVD